MAKINVSNATTYKFFKERANHTLRHFAQDLDPGILPVVRELNAIEGIAPVWSCESHPKGNAHLLREAYVICVVTGRGMDKLEEIYKEWMRLLDQDRSSWRKDDTAHSRRKRVFAHHVVITTRRLTWPNDFSRHYTSVCLGYERLNAVNKRLVLLSFEQAIRNVTF
ncbi:hypothetical protein RAY_314 [Erwinia phage vB_EamM_RAY]|uniref:Uncharacterized protein n=5 Tax=Agricanvirus TaxID=1984776 RepID=A0A173GEL8_9CAUD|nr:hypothetical protein Ea357_310 [Erwinia phage Ea35-70]YP_009605780.1 hypothetical protein FDH98_gp204 [Erwinia phage vB_EamM_RAY]AUG86103.1 hypothetical protein BOSOLAPHORUS_317 [Erwinia phage vB_EamM_Bosolaphorus]AUG86744.1 hypothetical protein MADMEL_317 [Erwinia phage vB_EamM_MadMel]AUG87069.1 hypothetical protein MORTIMER_321 [Erwinia phage vB_EamM_Mortimer]AHI60464.1 hypothetical protein Ea357_310 [Erwinia phage Ea35-70]ANH52094.1 hypothetical protein RAY_314 [Erwinia phage vB_EamM_RA